MTKNSTKQNAFGKTKTKAELQLMIVWVSVKSLVQCLAQYALFLWQHNPLAIILQRQRRLGFVENYGEILIKPRFVERAVDLFLTDYRRRKRLLNWVHSRLHHVPVFDFSSSWQDGIALCALLESVCPGVCPSFHLLQQHNRVKNCRLGLKLANKYLYLPMDLLSPEEMAIAEVSTEPKIIQYVSMVKWASQNVKDKWASLHESLIAAKTGKCFAKGAGLRNGIAGRRSKFTIIISDTIGVFNLLVEVRGPNNEYCGERIVSLHQAKGMLDKGMIFDLMEPNRQTADTIKYMEDGSGSTFVRKKVPPRYAVETITENIHLEFQCGEEGSFYVTFVPKRAGMHNVSIKWQNHHIEGSPYRVKVYKASNISTKTLKGAQEKRVIYDSLSFSVDGSQEDSIAGSDRLSDDSTQNSIDVLPPARTAAAIAKSKAYSKGRQLTVTRRRVLRRIITRNGEDIVIEEAVSPTLSRQSSATDNSDDDSRFQKHSPINDPIKEVVPSHNTLMPTNFDLLSVTAHAPNRLCTVEEEDREKLSSVESSSSGGQALDTDAVKDALNKFKSQSSTDGLNPKRRKYSIDVNDDSDHDKTESYIQNKTNNTGNDTVTAKNDALTSIYENVSVKEDGASSKDLDTGYVEEGGISKGNHSTKEVVTTQELNSKKDLDAVREVNSVLGLKTIKEDDPLKEEIGNADHITATVKDHGIPREADVTKGDMDKADVEVCEQQMNKSCNGQGHTVLQVPDKTPAFRTRSDGPLYELRKEVVSAVVTMTSNTSSESSSELSSGEITSPDEVHPDSSPQLKLLHSSSLKKACMYVSQNAAEQEEKAVLPLKRVKEIKKTKLTASRSLPIMRKFHHNDQVDKCSINDLLKCLKQLERDTSVDAYEADKQKAGRSIQPIVVEDRHSHGTSSYMPAFTCQSVGSPKLQNVPTNILNVSRNSNSPFDGRNSYSVGDDKITILKDQQDWLNTSKETKEKENEKISINTKQEMTYSPGLIYKSENQKDNAGLAKTPPREPLKRQNPIRSKTSSQESSNESEKRSRDKTSESTEIKDKISETTLEDNNVFRSISIQRSPCKDTLYTSLVHIVIPKPKVDKSTQVSHTEITAETGWNVIEGIYLLLRRMSINVPTLPAEIGTACDLSSDVKSGNNEQQADNTDKVKSPCIENSSNIGGRQMDEQRILPRLNIEPVRCENNIDARNMNHVDDWLERNQQIMNLQANLEPARQMTEETVDSGYDDNPLNFNRHPRLSLPLIRQGNVNGHPRLFRRTYNGQMYLPAKLVLSTSSQSQGNSFETREKGDDADDEYDNSVDEYNFDSEKLNLIRKRRHFSRRVESFSLSDSELETKKSSYKRNRRGWKDVLLVNRLFPKKERGKTLNTWISEKPGESERRRLNATKKMPSLDAAHQLSIESTDDDVTVFTDSTEQSHVNQKHRRMNLRIPHPPTSWKDLSSGSERQQQSISSLDESYRGFGVSKPARNDFLSHIDEFQNIYPVSLDIDSLERNAIDDDDSKLDIKSVSKMSMSSRSTESDEMEENEMLRSYIREKRHSWDGILDGFSAASYHFDQNIENGTGTDSQSDGNGQADLDRFDAISDVENVFGDDGSYIGEFMANASNVDFYECFDQSVANMELSNEHESKKMEEHVSHDFTLPTKEEVEIQGYFEDIEKRIRVAGPGLYHGEVGVTNSFQVWSCDPGTGSLNVSITGPRPHTVAETSVLYTGDNLYEVAYEVTQPGFYKIFVKYADIDMPNSPFIVEVTY